jgi:hypothetical protein
LKLFERPPIHSFWLHHLRTYVYWVDDYNCSIHVIYDHVRIVSAACARILYMHVCNTTKSGGGIITHSCDPSAGCLSTYCSNRVYKSPDRMQASMHACSGRIIYLADMPTIYFFFRKNIYWQNKKNDQSYPTWREIRTYIIFHHATRLKPISETGIKCSCLLKYQVIYPKNSFQ